MRFADNDRIVLIVNDHVPPADVPSEAHGRLVNERTPIEWFIDRDRVPRGRESWIVDDPNRGFPKPEDPVNAIRRIVQMSVSTVRMVAGLPQPLSEPNRIGGRTRTGESPASTSIPRLSAT